MNRLSQFIVRRYKAILAISLLVALLCLLGVSRLGVSSNMEEMLPEDSEAFKAGKAFDQYFDSQDNAMVVVQGDGSLCRLFLQDLEKKLISEKISGKILYRVNVNDLKAYAPLYLDRAVYEKADKAISAMDLDTIAKLLSELSQVSSPDTFEYLVNEEGNTYMMVVKPILDKEDFVGSRQKFYDTLKSAIDSTLAISDFKVLRAGLTGGALIADIEADSVAFDGFTSTFLLTLFLIILLIVVSYRKIVLPVSFVYPLLLGTLASAAIAWLIYGSLNMFSVSFALLLIGLGIDYAIHLISRYYEERGGGVSVTDATVTAVRETGVGIFYGAVTTAIAFLAFILARFKAFEQMGVISCIGIMVLCLIMILVVPALIQLLERRKNSGKINNPEFRFLGAIGNAAARRPFIVMLVFVLLIPLFFGQVSNSRIIGDIDKIYPSNLESRKWEKTLIDAFGYSPNVLTFMVADENQLIECTQRLESQDGIEMVQSALDYLPEDQDYKLSVIRKLNDLLAMAGYPEIEALKLEKMTVYDLPEAIRTNYVGREGRLLVEVVPSVNVYQQENYQAVKKTIEKAGNYQPVGMPAIMNEVVTIVQGDVIKISLLCLGAIIIFLLMAFRSVKCALICAIPLLFTLYLTLGLLPVIGTEINIFSVASFPLIIGIGIDSSIHLLHRLRGEKSKSVREAVTHTGKAILLTTLTTLLGFGSLAFINHPGMANLGVTVALGMTISLITTLVFIPAAYVLTMSKKEKTSFYHFESTDGQ